MVKDFCGFVRESLAKKKYDIPSAFQYVQWKEYYDQLEAKKKGLYLAGYKDFKDKHILDSSYTLCLKKHEFSLKNQLDRKARNLFNPTRSTKAILGWINYNLLKLSKVVNPSFIHGKNTGEVAEIIQLKWKNTPDPVFVTWDGSNYDSHQYYTLIESVDH